MKTLIFTIALILTAAAANALEVTLEWDPNTEADLDHYTVYEATKTGNASGPWEEIAQTPKTQPTYTATVPDQENFTWYVTASDTAGNESQASNTVDLYDKNPPKQIKNLRKAQPTP